MEGVVMTSKVCEFLFDYIKRMKGVSMVEIERIIYKDFRIPIEGDGALQDEHDDNLVYWWGMSKEFVDIFKYLIHHYPVDVKGTHQLVYIIDGKVLNMPLAKRPPKGGYKNPHWVPVEINPA